MTSFHTKTTSIRLAHLIMCRSHAVQCSAVSEERVHVSEENVHVSDERASEENVYVSEECVSEESGHVSEENQDCLCFGGDLISITHLANRYPCYVFRYLIEEKLLT